MYTREDLVLAAVYGKTLKSIEEFSEQWHEYTKIKEAVALLLSPEVNLLHLGLIDPRTEIAIAWSIEDVQSDDAVDWAELTDRQALNVLNDVRRGHDATIGISWDSLIQVAEERYPDLTEMLDESGRMLIGCYGRQALMVTPAAFYHIMDETDWTGSAFLREYTWDATIGWADMFKDVEGVEVIDWDGSAGSEAEEEN